MGYKAAPIVLDDKTRAELQRRVRAASGTSESLAPALSGGAGVRRSQLWGILHDMDLKPHLVRGWLNRRDDPEFWDRVQDVCGLYLSPPDKALVVSVDEKTGIQA